MKNFFRKITPSGELSLEDKEVFPVSYQTQDIVGVRFTASTKTKGTAKTQHTRRYVPCVARFHLFVEAKPLAKWPFERVVFRK